MMFFLWPLAVATALVVSGGTTICSSRFSSPVTFTLFCVVWCLGGLSGSSFSRPELQAPSWAGRSCCGLRRGFPDLCCWREPRVSAGTAITPLCFSFCFVKKEWVRRRSKYVCLLHFLTSIPFSTRFLGKWKATGNLPQTVLWSSCASKSRQFQVSKRL